MEFKSSRPAHSAPHQPSMQRHEAAAAEVDETPPKSPTTFRPTPPAGSRTKAGRRRPLPIILGLLLLICLVGWLLWSNGSRATTAIDSSKYQAVFLQNGQVYFGKLQLFNNASMKLTDIYYLQSKGSSQSDSSNPQQTSDGQNVELIKLGDEIHGPEDEMIILREQVMFYENLKPGGKVTKSIEQHKQLKKQ